MTNRQTETLETFAQGKEKHSISVRDERLSFTPVYVIVGMYRLLSDKNLRVPTWKKCKHGFIRGSVIGLGWAIVSFKAQRWFVEVFLRNSPRVTGLSHDTLFGYQLPFSMTTYATVLLILNQTSAIINFFLSKNIRIARDRAWDYTVQSRGKDQSFWGPYVEEYAIPPKPQISKWERWASNPIGRIALTRIALFPLSLYPIAGVLVKAYFRSLGTARYLHKRYFEVKKMTTDQINVFIQERKWHYRAFGFVAALLEEFPIVGIMFSVSNRVGAAMWAHDLQKQQNEFAHGEKQRILPNMTSEVELDSMVGSWKESKTQ